jgi:hypothetical protein
MLLEEKLKSDKDEKQILVKQQKETERRLESLEEKYFVGDIAKDLFEKYRSKYKDTLDELATKIDNLVHNSSNFKKAISIGVEIASNLNQLWVLSGYSNKQKLQYILFPEGLLYNKQNDTVRTPRVNSVFSEMSLLASVSGENKNGRLINNSQKSRWVALRVSDSNLLLDALKEFVGK